jgi:hypothetical protein
MKEPAQGQFEGQMETKIITDYWCDECEQYFADKFELTIHSNFVDPENTHNSPAVYHAWSTLNPEHKKMEK